MPQDLLDDAQIGAAGEHVGGEGMAQRVRMKVRHADEAAGLGDEGVHTAEVDFAYERTSSGRPRSR